MVGNFMGQIFCGLGSSDGFLGLYFCDVRTTYVGIYVKFNDVSWISRVHEIHEILNPTEITTVYICMYFIVK